MKLDILGQKMIAFDHPEAGGLMSGTHSIIHTKSDQDLYPSASCMVRKTSAGYADPYSLCSMDKNIMKTLIVLLLLIPFYAFAGAINIAPENMVILQSDYPYKSSWTPTQEQIQNALTKVREFIDNPSDVSDEQKNEIAKIRKNLSSYKVQFAGIEVKGERRIWCNFFSGQGFDYWKEKIVVVHDGGFWFWQIEYVEKTGKCINFISNGYA